MMGTRHLAFGRRQELGLELTAEQHVVWQQFSTEGAQRDIMSGTRSALATGTADAPKLEHYVVAGDRIVLTLEPGMAGAGRCAAAVVASLLEHGMRAADISILQTQTGARDRTTARELRARIVSEVRIEEHAPRERNRLAYLASTQSGRRIYANRSLCDADVVVPLGGVKPVSPLYPYHVHSGWYPRFCDSQTRRFERRRRNASLLRPGKQSDASPDAWEVAEKLGIQYMVQVVPGFGIQHAAVLAGPPQHTEAAGREAFRSRWSIALDRTADLVIAAVPGDHRQQTWHNLADILARCESVVCDGGTMAIMSELRSKTGKCLSRLSGGEDWETVLSRMARSAAPDLPVAYQLNRLRGRIHVRMHSQLAPELATSLGIKPLVGTDDLQALASDAKNLVVLPLAQHAEPFLLTP